MNQKKILFKKKTKYDVPIVYDYHLSGELIGSL